MILFFLPICEFIASLVPLLIFRRDLRTSAVAIAMLNAGVAFLCILVAGVAVSISPIPEKYQEAASFAGWIYLSLPLFLICLKKFFRIPHKEGLKIWLVMALGQVAWILLTFFNKLFYSH